MRRKHFGEIALALVVVIWLAAAARPARRSAFYRPIQGWLRVG